MVGLAATVLFAIIMAYQTVYTVAALFYERARRSNLRRSKKARSVEIHVPEKSLLPRKRRFAVLIAARNEEAVIGALIDSIRAQDYPAELVDIFVGADNCDDRTASVAAERGAVVFERRDTVHVGKGYVLKFLLDRISASGGKYDAFLVFDADNLLDRKYIDSMNRTLSEGFDIAVGFRASKNFGDSWVSAGCSLWFLRESLFLNLPRYLFGVSCAVSGTGFAFTGDVIRRFDGWNCFLLTEDIEFTVDALLRDEKIGFSRGAVLYDEQPARLSQSMRQRVRWVKGTFQVLGKRGVELISGAVRSFSCFDMAANLLAPAVLPTIGAAAGIVSAVLRILSGRIFEGAIALALPALTGYLGLVGLAALLMLTGGVKGCPNRKKLFFALMFPVFIATNIPVFVTAVFTRAEWKPIKHTKNVTVDELRRTDAV